MTRPDEITFVVISNGNNHEKLKRLLTSIEHNGEHHLKSYEINLCGEVGDFELPAIVNYFHLPEDASNARLGDMRNIGCENATKETICILDDDFILAPDWVENIPHNYFDIMTSQVRVPDGGRYWDHACYMSPTKGHVILMPDEKDDCLYMSGGCAWMMKRKVWEKVKWDSSGIYNMSSLEEYKEGKHNEDTHFSLRCRENKFLLIHNHDSISFHDDDSYTNVGRICNRRRDDRSYSWVLDLSLSFSPSVLCDFAVSLFSNGFLPESADILRYGLINFPSNYDLQKTFESTIVEHSGVLEDSRYSPNGDPLYLEFKSFYDDGSDSDFEPEGLTQEQMNIL